MIAFSKQPPANVLVNNPVLFRLISGTNDLIRYTVRINNWHGITNYVAFEGILLPVGLFNTSQYECSLNISEILKSYQTQAAIDNPNLLVSKVSDFATGFSVLFQQGSDSLTYNGRYYRGGTGKKMNRYLNEKNTGIFAWKLLNTGKQFFMTTRTSGRHIVVRENELEPFFFVATGKAYRVVTEYGNTFDWPSMTPGEVYAFDVAILRQLSFNSWGKLPAFFGVLVDAKYVFDITVTESAKSPDKYVIRFLNSFSAFEKIEVTGKAQSDPEFAGNEAFMLYDMEMDDYTEQKNRSGIREIIKAECGYKSPEEFLFLRDMLQSDLRYLIDRDGNRHEVIVSADNFTHDVYPTEPGSVQLKIRFVETDSNYSPQIDESLPDFNFGESIWQSGITNAYGFLFAGTTLNTL